MKIHPFYRSNDLRVHEIPKGVKCPVEKGWPSSEKRADDVEPLLDGERFNKYGWLLDDCHVVVDIDVHDKKANGYESLQKLELALGYTLADACGAIVDSPSGGRHYYFSKPTSVKFGKVFADRYPGIDFISGRGKQVVAANSMHDDYPGEYQLSQDAALLEMPESLIEHLQGIRKEPPRRVSYQSLGFDGRSGDEFNKSGRGLALLLGELAGCGYATRQCGDYWEFDRPGKTTSSKCSGHVGKLSKAGNYQLTCFTLSDDYFPSGEAMTIFHAYSLLKFHGDHTAAASDLHGKGFSVEQEPVGVDLSLLLGKERTDDFDDEEFAGQCVPESGLLRDVYDYYCSLSHRKSDVMGLAVAVSLCETIFGRRVASHTDLRTNDYNVIIAPTNCGKEACEKAITKIIEAANPQHDVIVPPDVQSGNGLMRAVAELKCCVWVADEFGKVLGAVLDKKQRNPHLMQIATHMLKLYGKADSTYAGAAHSNGTRNKVIQPHLCVLGLTTASTLFESVDATNVSDGLFGRIAFWPVQSRPPRRRMKKTEVPESLSNQVGKWLAWMPSGNLGHEFPDPVVVSMSGEGLARWQQHSDAIDDRMEEEQESRSAIWGRVSARAMKLSLVHRAARIDADPASVAWDFVEIEIEDVEWGIRVANWLARIACELIDQNFVDNTAALIRDMLGKAVARHDEVSCRDVLRACRRFTKGEVLATAREMESEGRIRIVEKTTGGRPKLVFCRPLELSA